MTSKSVGRPLKISMVSEHASPLAPMGGVDAGGQNVHVAELSAALTRRGHEVTVYTRRDNPHLPDATVTPDGYTVVHVPAGPAKHVPKDDLLQYMGDFGTFLLECWKLDPPDIAHAHFWMSGLATELAARSLGLPVIQTFHALGTVKKRYQGAADTSPPSRIRMERLIAARATRVAATCSDEVFELARMGLPRTRTSVVPGGVDLETFTPQGPTLPRGARRRIVSAGRLVPRKGFDVTISALPSLPDTELVIAGGPAEGTLADDAEAQRLLSLAADLGVADRVHILGRQSRGAMPDVLRSADVVVCMPWYEPFGIVPLEAMACAKPVVAAAVGGLLDTVVDGITGRLVPPRDSTRLAATLADLFSDSVRRDEYGVSGYDRARSRYSWDRVAADTLRVYYRANPQSLAAEGADGAMTS